MQKKTSRPRILVVAQDFPWPIIGGSLQRLVVVIDELSSRGDVDLFALVHPRRAGPFLIPPDTAIARSAVEVLPEVDLRVRRRPHWLRSGLPMELAAQDFTAIRRRFAAWAASSYDLVWISKVSTWAALGGPALGPTVLDLDDLEDYKIRAAVASERDAGDRAGRSRVHFALASAQSRWNARCWKTLQHRAAVACSAVALCSELDVDRAAIPHAQVLRNGYPDPKVPATRVVVNDAPTLLFAGVLYYAPNTDAARWLATEIAPQLRTLRPEVEVRLVGATNPTIEGLHRPPSVTTVGWVENMSAELARADLVVAPLRSGSGTRIKILEAFAHRIPVVSTTLGAEGLNAVHGVHVLLADDAREFATACARVLSDQALRIRMTDAAFALYQSAYTTDASRAALRLLIAPLLERSDRPRSRNIQEPIEGVRW